MKHAFYLGVVLLGTWLLWSGHYTPLIISFGVASCAVVVWITHRMDTIDDESVPLEHVLAIAIYLPWLCWQVILSSLAVARIILSPKISIDPGFVNPKMSQKTDLGEVIHANSITLTPGTVSVELHDHDILTHALTKKMADELMEGAIDRRVDRMEGGS
ncbi:MAG: Na+/H+ antiporter subunit E [Gemmatimonadetes bacterium]|nr:Na+/H+ antiporter subunit E [Gemmatimonadota bacterium]